MLFSMANPFRCWDRVPLTLSSSSHTTNQSTFIPLIASVSHLDDSGAAAPRKTRGGTILHPTSATPELARELYGLDLEAAAAVASDRRMTESIALAVQLDGPNTTTCITCKGPAPGGDCPLDRGLAADA